MTLGLQFSPAPIACSRSLASLIEQALSRGLVGVAVPSVYCSTLAHPSLSRYTQPYVGHQSGDARSPGPCLRKAPFAPPHYRPEGRTQRWQAGKGSSGASTHPSTSQVAYWLLVRPPTPRSLTPPASPNEHYRTCRVSSFHFSPLRRVASARIHGRLTELFPNMTES